MHRLAAVVIAACVAGAALAQDEAPPRFEPQWEERPSARDFARHMPRDLVENGVASVVHLCCTPRDDRRLDCRVAFEWPQQRGFGDASLRIARGFRLTPDSQAAFRADANAWLQIPFVFQPSHPPREFEGISQRIGERTRGLCAPAGVDPGPPLELIVMTVG
jgi:hypothetical protein